MREQDALRDFYFNRNKFCSIIISLIFFIFSNHVYGESVKDIICVGPDNAGDTASEGGTNPCNLHASAAAINVNVNTTVQTIITTAAAADNSDSDADSTGSVR